MHRRWADALHRWVSLGENGNSFNALCVIPPEKPPISFTLNEMTPPGQYPPGNSTALPELYFARGTIVIYCAPGFLDTDALALCTFPNMKPCDIFGG